MENDKYIGRLLGGRYELIDVVGVGGMAVVYRARDTILGRYVAIKILKEEFAKDPDIPSASPSSPVLSPSSAITISFRSMTSETRTARIIS